MSAFDSLPHTPNSGQKPNTETTKYCPRCKTEKPLTAEYFGKNRSTKDGFGFYCRECGRELDRAYYNSEKGKATRKAWKNSERGRTLRKINSQSEKRIASKKAYYQSEHYREWRKKWRTSEKARAITKAYRKTETYKARTKTERGLLLAKVRDANKHAKAFGVPGRLKVQDMADLFSKYNTCLCCGTIDNLTVDHIVPIAKGGSNTPDNLQVLCRTCNNKKGIKIIDYRRDSDNE